MKSENIVKTLMCFVLAVISVVLFTITAFAIDADGDGFDDETGEYIGEIIETEPVTDEPVYTEPETYAPITEEPVITDPPAEPVTDEPVYTEPETEQENTYAPDPAYIETVPDETEYFEPPTLPKTVSNKHYTTNYTAGIISWACVGAGILVVVIVLISNKISGRKNTAYR